MILIVIGFLIILYSLLNFKKAYFAFLIYQIYWYYLAEIIKVNGIPVITIGMIMSMWFLILFLIKKRKYVRTKVKMPYTIPIVLILCSMFITCFTGLAGFNYEFSRALSLAVQTYPTIWISWYLIESEEDFRTLLKGYVIIFFIAAIFGLIEYLLKDNILIGYKSLLKEGGIRVYTLANGRGYRIMSVFEHCIGGGMTFGLYAAFIFILYISTKKSIPYKTIAIISAALCIPCVILTKMRSAMIFTVICFLAAVDFKKKKFYKFILLGIVVFIAIVPLIQQNSDLFLSLFDSNVQKKLGGSNWTMRLSQLEAVTNLMKMSPIGGLGEKFNELISNQYTVQALDYESLWFEQMVKHGLVGVFVYLVMIVYSVIIVPRRYKSKELFIVSSAYWFTYTITSIPSFRTSFYYFVLFYFIKHSKEYKHIKEVKVKRRLCIHLRRQRNLYGK